MTDKIDLPLGFGMCDVFSDGAGEHLDSLSIRNEVSAESPARGRSSNCDHGTRL